MIGWSPKKDDMEDLVLGRGAQPELSTITGSRFAYNWKLCQLLSEYNDSLHLAGTFMTMDSMAQSQNFQSFGIFLNCKLLRRHLGPVYTKAIRP